MYARVLKINKQARIYDSMDAYEIIFITLISSFFNFDLPIYEVTYGLGNESDL